MRTALALPLFVCLSAGLMGGFVACSDDGDAGSGTDLEPCGVRVCNADEDNGDNFDVDGLSLEEGLGKADAVDRVERAVAEATQDGVLDVDDVDALFEAAGEKVSAGEIGAIHEALFADATYEVTEAAQAEGNFRAWTANLSDIESEYLADGFTFGQTEIPAAVLEVVTQARWGGAVAYDVNERDDDNEGIWSPYGASTPAAENMAWDYTEITPQKLEDDVADVDVKYNAIIGTETAIHSSGQEYKRAKYEERSGGTGHVLSHYDEVYHPDIYARGSQGQKWANNFAILADGSVHCLPASRRSYLQDVILTNPQLSRGARLLFNGHLDIREGIVQSVEMSGRLSKMAAKGKARFIDPLPLLEAWGFKLRDGVTLRYGNTKSGVPERVDGLIVEAPADDTTN